jgi:arylsulfatase
MIELWWSEAGRNGVLPLDDRRVELWRAGTGWADPRSQTRYVYRPPLPTIGMAVAPALGNRTFTITAEVERERADQEGCILSFGDGRGGLALYLLRGHLVFDYNVFGQHLKVVSNRPAPAGETAVGVAVERLGNVGRATLLIGGDPCGSVDIPFLVRSFRTGAFNLGCDHGVAVSDDYTAPFVFQGKLGEVVIEIPTRTSAEAKQASRADMLADLARQ